MWLSRKKFLLLAVCALAYSTYGCSNVEQASDPGSTDSAAAASSADSVGSIPEDLLAKEEKGQATEGTEATGATEATDPFSDLKEGDKKEEAAKADSTSDPLSLLDGGDSKENVGSGKMDMYTVKSGDTLMKVAFTIYGDIDRWKDLQQWNAGKIKKASVLSKGMKLKYEVPLNAFEPEQHAQSYVIKKGDTLANIADEVYGRKMKFKKLQGYNAKLIRNPNRIFAGFTIFYDITAKEIAEAEARRQERMAGGGGAAPATAPEATSMVPSAIAPPAEDLKAPAPIAAAPAAAGTQTPAPASTTDMAPPPPPPAAN
ncbi:MAG: LysM peptidoglycan-binding domain-containing protein [Bdellovibrionota bacterium]